MKTNRSLPSEKGSVLVVVMIFAAIFAAILIPSYLQLSRHSLEQSNRVFYQHAALNLAESGLEHAVEALISAWHGQSPWQDWQVNGSTATLDLPPFALAGNTAGNIRVVLLGKDGDSPSAVAIATIHIPERAPIQRVLQADIGSSGSRGFLGRGMVARGTIQSSGGAWFDSWNSNPTGNPDDPFVPYSSAVATDNIVVASVLNQLGSISLGSSKIYGYASVGAGSEFGLVMTWGGQVGPRDPNEWHPDDTTDLWKVNGRKVSYSTDALMTDFTFTFEDIGVPSDLNPSVQGPYHLPYTKQVEFSNQWSTWYQNVYVAQETIGSQGESTVVEIGGGLTIGAAATLTIAGDVTLILPDENMDVLRVIAGGKIVLEEDASLTVFSAGNVEISGAGIVNNHRPSQVQLYGTASDSQSITFLGSGNYSGIIFAPNADISLPGNTKIYGSVVGNNFTISGSGSIHYDESLEHLVPPGGGEGGAPSLTAVREVFGADRSNLLASVQ